MKISKHVHSCLLVEEDEKVVLIDPGNYTFDENALNLNELKNLNYLLVTHEHSDHMSLPLIQQVLGKFPRVKIISNVSVKDVLGKEGIEVQTKEDDFIQFEPVSHEEVFSGRAPTNLMFTIAGKLTHPGDSFSFDKTTEILALPVQAPWGCTTEAVKLAEKLRPKVIIPIHDWHWNEKARLNMYKRLEDYFKPLDILFKTDYYI